MSDSSDRIDHILKLVGPAVLLPWCDRSKGDRRKWKHLQLTDMDKPTHRARLEKAGNIGVALGQVSNGLVTIDLDQDIYVERLLAANPLLRNTLRTRAFRGCNIWLRCLGDYPRSCNLIDPGGNKVGEWRADGNQTIISGTHPEGMSYRIVVERPPITVSYDGLIWPETIVAPHATESNRVRRVGENEVVGGYSVNGSFSSIEAFTEDLIAQVEPTDFHQNNTSLFKLARLVRSYESAIGRLAANAELEFVFDRWCLVARRFWQHTRDDYWAEFLQAYYYARLGLNQDPVQLALNRARTMPLPELTGFSDERVRVLAAICREMQRLVGDGSSFFLPTRKLAQLLGAHWSSVARWLVNLDVLGVIRLAPGEARKRGGSRCPRYYYGQSEPEASAA